MYSSGVADDFSASPAHAGDGLAAQTRSALALPWITPTPE